MDVTRERLVRMARTADDLAAAVAGHSQAALTARPSAEAWSATEVVCHLRDIEEFYLGRIKLILANQEPTLVLLDPDRWAKDRQYRRNDLAEALATFREARAETLAFLAGLAADQWERRATHPIRGPITVRNIVHSMAKHDQVHLAQLERAIAGQV
jgi:uncharacterized damage-inducible protein DinB